MSYLLLAALLASIFLLDRGTKYIVMADADAVPRQSSKATTRLIGITQHYNFGLLADLPVPQWFILTCTGLAIIGLAYLSLSYLTTDRLYETYPLALILGGALSNLWDRIRYGYVFDWILLFGRSVINIADIAIGLGIVWFVVNEWKKRKAHPQ